MFQLVRKLFLALIACLALIGGLRTHAQEYEFDLGKAVDMANDWALTNLDPQFLNSLREADRARVEKFLGNYLQALRGSNVLELAALRSAATNIIPILESYEETSPYATWLRTRVDYFEVSEELQRSAPMPPPRAQSPPASAFVNVERRVWVKKLSAKPPPPGAEKWVPRLKPIFTAESTPVSTW